MTQSLPNILVFLTDDHGQWASSANGNRELHTPVMQWMADTGVCVEKAFCLNPVCSPARASFWTGQIPSRHGLHDYLGEPNESPDHRGIAGQPTLGLYLKQAGYRTGMVGKWHAGDYWTPMPGFDTWFTSLQGTNARFQEQEFVDGTDRIKAFGHQEVFYTERAIQFLREPRGEREPFFLYVGYTNTHSPHTSEPAPLRHHYRNCAFQDIPREEHVPAHGHARVAIFDPDEPARRAHLADYYAAVENIDQQMLHIITELENRGELENTLIVYTSDHGHMNGHHGLHTKANATLPANFLEESIRVPLLLRGPGIPAAQTTVRADHCDLFATLLDAAGCPVREHLDRQRSPGESLLPALRNPASTRRALQFSESGPNRMVRSDTDKLILRYPHPSGLPVHHEYYDLAADPRETVNRYEEAQFKERIRFLRLELETFFGRYAESSADGLGEGLKRKHNAQSLWNILPGETDHRQGD
ncbi:MAG: sulfatase-like hydrolase/transferase [Verrucomicrobia bacterium]|nr:sulfatase-like hydrolase/transferase [Verrucomicrobiota bacterium]MCH8527568.1 sulfatase-like hydrolase/transferase [Kiritimatiellia bacterium]